MRCAVWMEQLIQYARMKSDATAQAEGTLEQHKQARLQEKGACCAAFGGGCTWADAGRWTLRAVKRLEREAEEKKRKAEEAANAPEGAVPAGPPQIPDELLPPNAILFVQRVPPGTDEDTLVQLFGPHVGFKEVRLVPGRSDIAFVEYASDAEASVAKKALNGHRLSDSSMTSADGEADNDNDNDDDDDNAAAAAAAAAEQGIKVTFARK